MTKNF